MKWFTFNDKVENTAVEKKRSAADYISNRQTFRMQEDLYKLRVALDQADNNTLYDREELHRIYREILKDPHLISQWGTRKLKTIEKEFNVVDKEGVKNDELTDLLEAGWFMDLMDAILDSKAWGFTFIEFGPYDKENKILLPYRTKDNRIQEAINVIDRDYVKPEFGYIGQDSSSSSGVPIFGGEFDKTTLFVGKHHSYGFLEAAAKYVLFKNNCGENWSEWAEVFGMDLRIGKTDAEGDAKKKFLDTLKNIGASGYGVVDKEDVVEYHGTARTDAYKVYEALMDTVDKNVSKLIFGQDVVSNNTGQVVGKVGENVSNLYGDSDAKYVARIINKEVFPKLEAMGFPSFKGFKFKWENSEKLTKIESADIDLKISQMGYKPKKQYLEEKYNTQLDEKEEPEPIKPTKAVLQVAAALKELYADSME